MEQEVLRKLQLTQLEILKEIDRVCREKEISYFLVCGTLLGAVRHQGFIPWDDDLDIGMLREDYERFKEAAPGLLKEQYEYITSENTPDYPFMFSKVIKKGTVFQEAKSKKGGFVQGIYVDVFAYDHFPKEKARQKRQGRKLTVLRALIRDKTGYATWNSNGKIAFRKLIKNIPFIVLSTFFTKSSLIRRYEKECERYHQVRTGAYFTLDAEKYGKNVLTEESIQKTVRLPFEDGAFPCPEGYDAFLKRMYGDYMELPPEEERGNRHQILELKF